MKKKKEQSFAQTQISKIYRGYKARGVGAAMAANKNVGKSAIKSSGSIRSPGPESHQQEVFGPGGRGGEGVGRSTITVGV